MLQAAGGVGLIRYFMERMLLEGVVVHDMQLTWAPPIARPEGFLLRSHEPDNLITSVS
jgi:hypothetical protein